MAERPIAEGTIRFSPDMRSLANVEKSVKKAIGRIENISARGGLLSKNYVQPLGQITGAADEFTKSLEASNARVIAFGASAGIIYNVQRAITASVSAAVELEKTLADINVILNETNAGLQRFSNELFNIAKGTGQSFNAVSEAALEFARQGLAVEETLKRTRDAMILVRLSGLDVKSSVESITATLNSFNQTVINSTELVNKLANVDAAFAVSSADLAEAIRRVGSSAQDSNVNIDQLIALVTTAQQVTARGGSVIGNSLKTIFTRLQRPQVIADLESFGIVVRDQQQNMLSTMQVLQNFANTYDQLSPSAKAVTAELVGGVFQINVLKAALGDLGKQYSIYDRALNVSLSSTNEAIARNELLNKTLSTLINETLINVQKVGAAFANLTITPTLTNVLESVNSAVEKLEEKAADGDLGVTFGKGILQGLSNVLSGPALIAIAGILGKLTFSFFKFSSEAVKTFAGLNSTANQQKDVQTLIQNLLIKNPSLIQAATSSAEGLKMVEQEILRIVQNRNVALNESSILAAKMSANLSAADFKSVRSINASNSSSSSGTSSEGFVPTFSNGFVPNYNRKNEQAEVIGALQGGYMPGQVQTMQVKGVGTVTWNDAETVKTFPGMDQPAIMPPRDSDAGRNYEKKFKDTHGFNPYSEGMVPNFAKRGRPKRQGNRALTPAKVMVREIYDGDSIVVDFTPGQTPVVTSTRLKGYDAFELNKGSSKEKEKGRAAKKRLEEYIAKNFPDGDVTKLFKDAGLADDDKYGRPFFVANRFGGSLVRDGLAVPYGGSGKRATKKRRNKAFGLIPNLAYEGLHDEDLGSAFINVNEANKGKSIDYNLARKDIEKRLGGKTLIRGPEGETLIVGGDLEGRAGSITVGGLSARKIKKANPKYAMLLDQVPGLFDGLAYEVMGAVGAKFDREGASGAVAGVKFEEEFAQAHGLPAAGAKKGSDFILADKMAKELGTQKHLQLKLSVFERSKRDVKKVVDVASSFSKYLVDMLTHNIKTQGLSRVVGPQRFKAAMGVLAKNPAIKNSWSGYFGKGGTMSGGFVPNFYLAESADYYTLAQQKEDEEVAELMSGRAQPSWKFGMYDKARAAGNTEDHANVDRVLAGQGQALRAMGVPEFISAYGTGRIKVPRPGMTFNTHDAKMRDRMRASGEVKGKDRVTYNAVYNEEDARRNVARRKHAIRTGMSASQFRQSFQKSNTSQIDNSVGMLREQKRVTAQEVKDEIHKSAAAGLAGSYGHWSQMAPKNSVAAQYYGAIEGMFKRAHGEVSKILTTSTKDFVKNKGIRSTGVHSSTVGGREFGTEMSHELLTRGNPLLSELESIDIAPAITGGGGGLQEVEQGAIASARSSGFIKQGQEAIQKYVEDLENMVINTLGRKAFEVAASEQKMNMFSKFRAFGPKQLKEMGTFSSGMIPNFARTAIQDAISREMGAGYSRSQVKVGYDSRLAASGGIGVYNTTEGSLSRAINMHRASGKSMKDLQTQGASHGFVPNYATDAGDFLGGGMGLALIAPAVMSMMDSMKEVRAERDKETKSIRGLREALEEAKNSTGHYTEEVTAAEAALNESNRMVGQEAARQSAAEQASTQAESDLAAVRGKKPISSRDIEVAARKARGDADPFAPIGRDDQKITAKQRKDARKALRDARAQEIKDARAKARETKKLLDVANEDLEVAEELAEIEGKKLAKAERKNEKSKGIVQAENKLAEAERNRSGLFDEKGALGNQAISKMGMGLSFAAPMIAGQLSQFSGSNTGVLGRASINALGQGIGTAGIMGTAGAEFGTKITKDLQEGTGLVGDTLGLSADKGAGKALGAVARVAGPAAMAIGIGKAIDDMGKAMAKAAIQEKADAIGGELELLSTQFNRVQQAGQAFMTSFDKLQQAYDSPLDTNPADVQRVQADLAKALSDAPAEFRNKIKAAAGDADKIREAFSEISTELQRQQASLKAAQDLFSMQADMAAGGGFFSQILGLEDTTIFEDDAQGKKALSAAKATVAGGLDRAGIIKALEQGRQLDIAGKDMSEFLGEDFKSAFDGLKDAGDQEKIRQIIRKFFKEIKDGAKDAAKVTKDLERRQAAERAYQKQLKNLNTQLDTFVSSLGKVAARVENNLKSVSKLADNIKDFQLDMAKARFEGAKTLQQPFLTKQEQVRSKTESRQFEIRADSIKQMRDAVRDGSFNVLNAVSGQFNEAAGKVQQAATDLAKPQSRENVVAFQRTRKALDGLAPIIENAFKTFSQNSGKLDALIGIEKQIESQLVNAGYTNQQANAIAESVKQEILSQKDATVNKLSEIAQQQVMQLRLQEEQAYWAQEEAKLQARLNSFGGASDFGRGGATNLSGNFDRFTTALSTAIGAQISKGVIELGRANSQILDLLLNNMNMDFLRDNVEGLSPLLGPAISGRAADIQSQISFASRLAGIQGVDIDTSGIDTTQIAVEQIASQLKLKDLPDDVAKIRENTTLLNSLIASQAHDISSANRGAFEDALKQTGLHHLDDNTANNILATRVSGQNSVSVGNAIGNTNKDGFNHLIFGVNNLATDLGGAITTKLEPFSTRMAEIGDLVNKIEAVQGGQGIIGKMIENEADLGIFETNEEKVEANRLLGIQKRIAGSNAKDLTSALLMRTQMEDAPQIPKDGKPIEQLRRARKVDQHPAMELLFGEKFEAEDVPFKSDLRGGIQNLAKYNSIQESDIDAAFKFAKESGIDTSTRAGAAEAMNAYLTHLNDNADKVQKFNEATKRKTELRTQAATYGQSTGTVLEEGAGGGRRFRAAQNMFEQATGRVAPDDFNFSSRLGLPKGVIQFANKAEMKAGLGPLSSMFRNREEQARYQALFDAANASQAAPEVPAPPAVPKPSTTGTGIPTPVGFGGVDFPSSTIPAGTSGAGGIPDVGKGPVSEAIASLRGKSLQVLQKQLEAAKKESADAQSRLKTQFIFNDETKRRDKALVEYNALLINGINGLIENKEAEKKRKELIEKMVAETRAQVSTMEAIAGNTPKLTELMELFGDVQRKMLDKKAFSAAEEILKLGVTGGDPEQIRNQIQSQFETGVNALTRVEGGNTKLAQQRAQRIAEVGLKRRNLGLDAFDDIQQSDDANPVISKEVQNLLDSGDIIGAAIKQGFSKEDVDYIRKQMESVGFSTVEAARMIRNSQIDKEFSSLVNFVEKAKAGLIDSEAINAKVESTFASFVKNGKNEEEVFKNISDLRKQQVKQRREEFKNELKTEKEKRNFRLDTKAMEDLNEAISKGQEGLLTARGTGEAINQAFAAFVEGGFNEEETFKKIKTLREQEAAKRGEEFGRQLTVLEENRQTELANQPIELNEALQKARKNLMSFSEIGQVIDGATQSYIEKGGDLNKIGKELEQLQLEKSAKAADEFARTLELVNAGLASASLLEEKRKQSFDRIFQERAQQGKGTFGGANRAELQLQKEDSEAAVAAELEAKLKLLNDARKHELLTADELRQKSAELADQMAETGNLGFKGFIGALQAELTYSQADYQKDILSMGREFTRDFKSGMAGAFGEAIRGTKSLKQAFSEMMANIADKMLDKSLNMAVNAAFGGLGFNKGGLVKGYNSGGIVKGGSGIKDDVPAYLSRGEYVIRKKTVNEYGKDFFDSLNSAKVVAANKGGMIDNTRLTKESADRIFSGKARNMAAIQAERQKRISALQRAGIESYGYKEATGANKKDIFGRDTGQKVLANRVGFRLDFGKPLNENRVKKIQEVVNAYPEVGPFIDPDIFKRSTVEIGGGATKLKLKNSFIYNETKRPDQGRFVADPRLSSLALNDENNPQNKYKFEKADTFFNYQKDRLEYYADKQKELQEFQDQKANRRRSFLFGAGALLFAGALKGFNKGGPNKEDDIPALLTGGEYVVRKGIVDKYGLNFFENLNRGRISAFNKGGYVAPITGARPTTEFQGGSPSASVEGINTTNNINISVNIDSTGNVTTQTDQGGSRNTEAASQEETKQMADRIKGAVIGVIAEQKRPGGMLYGTSGSV